MSVTISEIAKKVGVNHATVSRVLNGQATATYRPAIERAKKIRRVAEELGYRPHVGAQAIVSGRFNCVSLLMSTGRYRSNLPGQLLQSISESLNTHRLRLDIAALPDEQLTDPDFMPSVLSQRCSDGLLVNYHAGIPPRMIENLESAHIPVVWMNHQRDTDSVCPDDSCAGRDAAKQLLRAGHRRIAYVDLFWRESADAGVRHYSKQARRDGVREIVESEGGCFEMITDSVRQERYDHFDPIRLALSRPDRPTGLVCYSEIEARVVEQVAAEMGLRLPNQLSIIGFGDDEELSDPRLRRNTMVVNQRKIGQAAVSMLLRKIDSPSKPLPSVSVSLKYLAGGSLCPIYPKSQCNS
ncbi:MAG: LacI family DNA-binding transcriptional regulator [Planctomycetota bacterium]